MLESEFTSQSKFGKGFKSPLPSLRHHCPTPLAADPPETVHPTLESRALGVLSESGAAVAFGP